MALSKEQIEKLNSIEIDNIDDIDIEEAMDFVFSNEENTNLFFEILGHEIKNRPTKEDQNDLYGPLQLCYAQLLGYYEIEVISSFKFPDYSDCRTVCVDDKTYDLDNIQENDDREYIKGLLYEIDAYCADIPNDLETILKSIEKYFNEQ